VEADSGAGITKEVPSKIHELHADAAELTPRRLQEVAYCQNREVTRKPENQNSGNNCMAAEVCRTALPVELFAEIQINKSQWGIQRTK